jgi:hypothetical protein
MATTYNILPSLEEADTSLGEVDFGVLKQQLADLIRPYRESFGFALIHNHFKLEDDEMMVEGTDGVTMPHKARSDYYPKRFDRDGNPYEYATQPQAAVPVELFEKFRALVPPTVRLGLYSRMGESDEELVEIPDATDRSHRMFQLSAAGQDGSVETTWWVSSDDTLKKDGCVQCHRCIIHQ